MNHHSQIIENPHPHIRGYVQIRAMQQGVQVKSACVKIKQKVCFKNMVFEPALRLVVLLDGHSRLQIGQQTIHMDAERAAVGYWLPVWHEEVGCKWFEAGDKQDELVLFFSMQWLKSLSQDMPTAPNWLQAKMSNHLRMHSFQITPQIRQVVSALRAPSPLPPLLHQLHQQGLVLTLFSAVCQQMLFVSDHASPLKPSAEKCVDKLTELLYSGQADMWSLNQMARYCGSNVTSLQRHFQQRHGVGIWHYLRQLKLARAYQALQLGADVSSAAEVAGYQHIESFSKAFKQQYGVNPAKINVLF